jgi:putative ABC transport system permease protein
MNELFGIPMGSLLAVLVIATGTALGLVAVLALRNRVLFRLGVRNAARRRGRTILIVVGLLLGTTIVAAALTTGDTMSNTIRQSAVKSLGETDVVVSVRGAADDIPGDLGAATGTGYFLQEDADVIRDHLMPTGLVDGVEPVIIEQVAVQDPASGQTEPGVNLFATDPDRMKGFGEIKSVSGARVQLGDLSAGEVYLNRKASEELRAGVGDRMLIFTGERPAAVTVRDVVDYKGAGTADAALLMPLDHAQRLLGEEGLIKHVAVSNRGSGTEGVGLSDRVAAEIRSVDAKFNFNLEPTTVKADALENADKAGNAFTAFFTTFGSFSIAAGILLIFLIFVMLAAERRGELGIARAVGTRRSHVVQMFVFEGLAYDLAAAAVGALLGAAVAFGMVIVMAEAFGATDADAGLRLEYAVTLRSLLIAFTLGVLLTLVVVAFSAWRVSAMTISTAIRNLPEPTTPRRRRRWLLGGLGVGLGLLLTTQGWSGHSATPLMLGVSLVLIGLVPVLLALRVPTRLAYTASGLLIMTLWMIPWSWWEAVFGDLSMDFSAWIASGLMVVIGAVWVIMYNADVLLRAAMRTLGRIRALTPILRLAVAYPLSGRFRTGTILAMFTLVVFTLVTGAVSSGSFMNVMEDTSKTGGGFDIRAGTGAVRPITDLRAAIAASPTLRANDFTALGSQSVMAVDAKQMGAGRPYEKYMTRGLDRSFLERTTFHFGAIARGYGSDKEVWSALASTPGLAVADSFIVPRRDNFNFALSETDFRLSGFYFDDGTFNPIPVVIRDPQTQQTVKLTVIGILSDTAPWEMIGLTTAQDTLSRVFPGRAAPTIHYFTVAPGVDPDEEAARLETAFMGSGLEANSIQSVVDDAMAASVLFNRLIQGFLGLGLVVGVAALGVVTARAVVERRQHIGVLRALGFRRRMVEAVFLLESSFVALTAIVVGTGLGVLLGYEIVVDQRRQASWQGMELVVPWANLMVVYAAVYVVAVVATLAPALRAARIRPAEALRYE